MYNKGKKRDQDSDDVEVNIVQDDSDDGTKVFMATVSKDQL